MLLLCLLSCPLVIHAFAINESTTSPVAHQPLSANFNLEEMARDIRLDYSSSEAMRTAEDTLQSIIQNRCSLDRLTVGYNGYRVTTNWTLLAQAIGAAQNLAALHWENYYYIPQAVLSILERQQPKCKLHYTMSFPNLDNYIYDNKEGTSLPRMERSNISGHPNLYATKLLSITEENRTSMICFSFNKL